MLLFMNMAALCSLARGHGQQPVFFTGTIFRMTHTRTHTPVRQHVWSPHEGLWFSVSGVLVMKHLFIAN